MDAKTGEQAPPDSTYYAGWRQAVADGRFRQFPLETIVAAIQDLRTNTDSGVRNALVKFLSDTIYTRLRRTVGWILVLDPKLNSSPFITYIVIAWKIPPSQLLVLSDAHYRSVARIGPPQQGQSVE